MRRKFADSRKAAANEAAAKRREGSMARQGTTRFKRENIDTDQKRGFFGDLAQMGRDLTGYDKVKDTGPVRDISTMVEDVVVDPAKKYLPGLWGLGQRGLDSLTGAWDEAQKARRDDGKWTLGGDPLDVTRGSDAYRYLLTQIDDPENRNAFRREVGKDNLHWTELNEYAGDNAAGLAKKINEYNEGIRSFPRGEDIYEDLIGQGKALRGTGMLGDAAADAAESIFEAELPIVPPFDDTIIDTTPVGFGEQLDYDELSGEFFPREAYEQSGVFGRGIAPMSPEESEFQMSLARDPDAPPPFGEKWYKEENPFREPYVPMEGPSPVPLPPYLSGDTDWFTPEPEEEDLRGWDWLNEPVMKHYGVDRPSEEIERVWPNTPPPGYPNKGRFLKYLDQLGFN